MKKRLVLLLAVACTPAAPAKQADHDKVVKSQRAWCAMLAEADGEKMDAWRHRGECLDAYPGSSAAFLGRMTTCYGDALKEYGDNAPDSGAIISRCSQDILAGAEPGDVTGTALYKARCARQGRCLKVSAEVCDGAWERLDGRTRAFLTSKYNFRTQTEIASCLDDESCVEDDASVEAACYEKADQKLVWLPLSLGHDGSLGPKVD